MHKKKILVIFCVLFFNTANFAQLIGDELTPSKAKKDTSYNKYSLPSVSGGFGIMTYFGDIGMYNSEVTHVGKLNAGYALNVEQRFKSAYGVSLNLAKGLLTEIDNRPYRHLNFQSDIFHANLGVNFHFDNDFIINKTSRFAPFISLGLGYMFFNAKGDIRDANGIKYCYWPDGTIRDSEYDWEHPEIGNILKRDYTFETELDSLNLFKHNSLIIPIGGGINFKFSDKLETNISSMFYITKTDAIDNLSYLNNTNFSLLSKHNDCYMFTTVTLQYNFAGKSGNRIGNKYYKEVNFAKLDKTDSDNDKVPDSYDLCPDTPLDVKVDNDGCPLDEDEDGVPNYLDKELKTPIASIVDQNGVAVMQREIEDNFIRDSLIMGGVLIFDRDSTLTISDVNDSVVRRQYKEYYNSLSNRSINQATNFGQIVIISNDQEIDNSGYTVPQITFNYKDLIKNDFKAPVNGVVFTVQIGSLANDNSSEYYQTTLGISEEIKVDAYQGAYKYTVGSFNSYALARIYANTLKIKSGINAFVVAFKDGERIPISDARAITGQ